MSARPATSSYARRVHASLYRLWQARKPLLPQLDLELTERCNNNCLHCSINLPQDDRQAQRRELGTDEVKSILTEAAALGALSVRLTGGEPLLRTDFDEIYVQARRLGLSVRLCTNARLITPALAGLFARIPPLEPIEVSVYGMHSRSYEAVTRAPGSYAEFRRGLSLLLADRIPVTVKTALLPPNRDELGEFEAWAANLPSVNAPPSCVLCFDLRVRRDSPAANERIAALRPSPEQVVALSARHGSAYRRSMIEFCGRFLEPPDDRLFSCDIGRGGCVDAYGTLYPCMGLRIPSMAYDLRKGSLTHALSHVFPRFRELRAANPDYLARCSHCFLRGLCKQCPAKSWSEHGTLDTPVEYLCRLAHAQARDLGLLRDGERAWQVRDSRVRLRRLAREQKT